jgi:anti-sigma B factor antagonist
MALTELPPLSCPYGDVKALPTCNTDGSVVWLRGEHDLFTLAELWETMARAIAFDDGDVVVDLSAVDFMDASTISVLVRARTILAKRSRLLTMRSPSTRASRVLRLCGLAHTA